MSFVTVNLRTAVLRRLETLSVKGTVCADSISGREFDEMNLYVKYGARGGSQLA